jgi:hypothetical protein
MDKIGRIEQALARIIQVLAAEFDDLGPVDHVFVLAQLQYIYNMEAAMTLRARTAPVV